jgi:hypothetical protein
MSRRDGSARDGAADADSPTAGELARRLTRLRSRFNRTDRFADARELAADVDEWRIDLLRYVAGSAPERALDLAGRLLRLDGLLIEHCDDSNGQLGDALRQLAVDWLEIAGRVRASGEAPERDWVRTLLDTLGEDAYGVREPLLSECATLLTADEIRGLAARFEREALQASVSDFAALNATSRIGLLAEALNDPSLYERSILIRSPSPNDLQAAHIAEHYLQAGDPAGALRWLQTPWPDHREFTRLMLLDAAYELQGDTGMQVSLRRQILQHWPDVRAYRRLAALLDASEHPLLNDEVAALATSSADPCTAAALLYEIGQSAAADELLATRYRTIDARDYERLHALIEQAEAAGSPVGVTAILRALLENILDHARSTAYGHGRRYLLRARALAAQLPASTALGAHAEWERELRTQHGRKRSFWVGV